MRAVVRAVVRAGARRPFKLVMVRGAARLSDRLGGRLVSNSEPLGPGPAQEAWRQRRRIKNGQRKSFGFPPT